MELDRHQSHPYPIHRLLYRLNKHLALMKKDHSKLRTPQDYIRRIYVWLQQNVFRWFLWCYREQVRIRWNSMVCDILKIELIKTVQLNNLHFNVQNLVKGKYWLDLNNRLLVCALQLPTLVFESSKCLLITQKINGKKVQKQSYVDCCYSSEVQLLIIFPQEEFNQAKELKSQRSGRLICLIV